jgi:hypothetical protein
MASTKLPKLAPHQSYNDRQHVLPRQLMETHSIVLYPQKKMSSLIPRIQLYGLLYLLTFSRIFNVRKNKWQKNRSMKQPIILEWILSLKKKLNSWEILKMECVYQIVLFCLYKMFWAPEYVFILLALVLMIHDNVFSGWTSCFQRERERERW